MNPMDFFRAVIGTRLTAEQVDNLVGKPAEGNPYADPAWLAESRESLARQEAGAAAAAAAPGQTAARLALAKADPFLAGYAYGNEDGKPRLGPAPSFLTLDAFAEHFARRYPLGLPPDEVRARAWLDNLEWRTRCHELEHFRDEGDRVALENLGEQVGTLRAALADRTAALELANKRAAAAEENASGLLAALQANHHPWKTALGDARMKLRAATARAEMLNAAIQYAVSRDEDCGIYAHTWLRDWNEGDESADDELRAWMESDNGKAMLGTAVVGRDGMPAVPAPVGCERPGPAPVQPAQGDPGDETDYPEPDTVSVHPAQIDGASWARASIEVPENPRSPADSSNARLRAQMSGAMYTQTPAQRDVCTNRVTHARSGREACNKWPIFTTGSTFCKGCPAMMDPALWPHG